jgi:hypothetical protein
MFDNLKRQSRWICVVVSSKGNLLQLDKIALKAGVADFRKEMLV